VALLAWSHSILGSMRGRSIEPLTSLGGWKGLLRSGAVKRGEGVGLLVHEHTGLDFHAVLREPFAIYHAVACVDQLCTKKATMNQTVSVSSQSQGTREVIQIVTGRQRGQSSLIHEQSHSTNHMAPADFIQPNLGQCRVIQWACRRSRSSAEIAHS
jgi:hypothetical protein